MDHSVIARKKWNRNARFYDLMTFFETKGQTRTIRRNMLASSKGKILEVGIGTGHNLQFYPDNLPIIGIDISYSMLLKAKSKAHDQGIKAALICMDAENLTFKDSSFDLIVSTCVFCSIPDPIAALKEIARVLKPQGRLLMYEHVLSKNKLIALIQNLLNPLIVRMGPNINRDTVENVQKAGLKIVKEENMRLGDIFKRIDAVLPNL